MKIGANGLDLIKGFEGLRLKAYRDSAGIPTIGYGHTKTARMGMKITGADAEELLRRDLATAEGAVNLRVEVPINQNQFDALVSFVFNLGGGAFRRSTLLRLLNAEDYAGAADQFPRWNKARVNGVLVALKGLTRRRAAERALFLEPEA